MKNFRFLVTAFVILSSSMASAQLAPPGNCTATQHRTLQTQVDNACGAALACSGTDDRATLNSKIGKASACIDARRNINNTCFAGGDQGHKDQVAQRTNQITNCQNFPAKVKP
jgi:Novel toxin 16